MLRSVCLPVFFLMDDWRIELTSDWRKLNSDDQFCGRTYRKNILQRRWGPGQTCSHFPRPSMFLSVTQSRTSNIGGLSSGKPTVLLRCDSLPSYIGHGCMHCSLITAWRPDAFQQINYTTPRTVDSTARYEWGRSFFNDFAIHCNDNGNRLDGRIITTVDTVKIVKITA